jgi:hypothetical protein
VTRFFRTRWRHSMLPRVAMACAMLALATGLGIAQDRPSTEEWLVDPMRGPTDLGLTDPSLVGAIDVHVHLDPDSPGTRGIVRAVDLFDAAKIAIARGMRGFVYKTHQDAGSASGAHLIRRHVSPTFEAFGRIASNYATGGINVAAVEHFGQIKGGWGRIIEMPTRDAVTSSTPFASKDPAALKAARPWMLMMPPDTPPFVAVSKDGELLPVVKHLIGVMAKMRTIDSRGAMVLATGHATPEEHLLLAREGRAQGLQVLLTHPGNIPQLPEAVKLGAFVEIVTTQIYRTPAGAARSVELIRKIGAEHIIISTDCGQTTNLYPSDCLVVSARELRARGITQREIDLMYKVNPAKLLGLPPPPDSAVAKQ